MNLREMERDLRAMTGSPASDAVTRATIGLELLEVLREALVMLDRYVPDLPPDDYDPRWKDARALLTKVQDV